VKVVDPFGTLQARHGDVVRAALQSDAAAYIRHAIVDHLVDIEDHDDMDEPFTRGYRMALRVAFIAAGGEVDGSEEQWAQLVEDNRG
jgi:hypothetical protein